MTLAFDRVSFGYRRRRPVVADLSLAFAEGATLLLGPNGAGKSTILGLAASALRPQAGTVTLGALCAVGRGLREYRAALAWMPQHVRYVPGLTVREQVAYVGWLKGLSKREAWQRSEGALARVGLDSLADERPKRMSGGQVRRLGVAQVLVHDAAWLLMDEPTAGLDPVQRADFHALVADLRRDMSIVISTHQTEDIGVNYDRVMVIDAGRIRFDGSAVDFLGLGGVTETTSEAVVRAYRRVLALA